MRPGKLGGTNGSQPQGGGAASMAGRDAESSSALGPHPHPERALCQLDALLLHAPECACKQTRMKLGSM